jgi:Xaa-Pro aminopeptidase
MNESSPTLSLKERDRRWSLTRELLKAHNVECLILPGLHGREAFEGYLSNEYVEGLVIFPLEEKPVLLTFTNTRLFRQIYSATTQGVIPWIDDTRLGTTGAAIVSLLKEKGFEKSRIGIVGLKTSGPGESEGFVPYTTWAHVLKEIPNATFVEMSEAFTGMMLHKSAEELVLVRHSASLGEAACKKMLEMVRPGLDERELYAAMMEVTFRGGSFPPSPFLIVHSGPENLGWGPPLWSYQGAPARKVEKGDLVQAEIFTRYGGFECQAQMSVHLKPVNPIAADLANVAREAYDAGLAALRPGNHLPGSGQRHEAARHKSRLLDHDPPYPFPDTHRAGRRHGHRHPELAGG